MEERINRIERALGINDRTFIDGTVNYMEALNRISNLKSDMNELKENIKKAKYELKGIVDTLKEYKKLLDMLNEFDALSKDMKKIKKKFEKFS
jgi:DNA repair ATPase RecN